MEGVGCGLLTEFLQDVHVCRQHGGVPLVGAFGHEMGETNGPVERREFALGA